MNARGTDVAAPESITHQAGLSWTRVRVPRLLSRIGKVCFLASSLTALTMLAPSADLVGGAAMCVGLLAWPLFILSYIISLTQTSSPGAITVSSRELAITSGVSERVIPVDAIAGALVVERVVAGAVVPAVEIELTGGDRLTARIADPRAAQEVVRVLGFGPGGRRVRATLAKATRRLLHPLYGFGAYTATITVLMLLMVGVGPFPGGEAILFAYPAVTSLLYALLQRYVRAPEVTVGEDGIAVHVHGKTRLIARRDIAFVNHSPGVLAIEAHSGKRVALAGVMLDHARLAAVARLILQRSASAVSSDRLVHYDRADRPLAAWRAHLAHAMNDASYRHNAATVDEAASVLRSAEATPEQRIGAALALRMAGQPREKIRVAVEAAADDRVREALEAVADTDDDEVIEKTLKRLQG